MNSSANPVSSSANPVSSSANSVSSSATAVTNIVPGDLWAEPLTDLGNARRLIRAFGTELRYLPAAQRWLCWDGRRWAADDTGQVHRFARQVVDQLLAAARSAGCVAPSPTSKPMDQPHEAEAHEAEADVAEADVAEADVAELAQMVQQRTCTARRDFARRSQSRARLEAMTALAQCEPGVPVRPADLNADRWLLCVNNGTVDLRSSCLLPHRREDLITRLAPVDYHPDASTNNPAASTNNLVASTNNPAAPASLWERTLTRILPDPQVRAFVQRSAGYALTGSLAEQCVFFWHGGGRNGKTTVIEALRHALGDYALETPVETFLARNGGGGGIPSDLARLDGARMVTARETEDGQRLAESLIKQVSGGDRITARFLFHEWFEFTPAFTLFLATNHRPQVKGTDEGLWRRIHLVPFAQTLSPEEVDRNLPEKLRAEGAGILAWAVQGCLQWQQGGLCPPAAVLEATQSYRSDMDGVGRFLCELCVQRAGLVQAAGPLYAAFKAWACEEEVSPVSPQEFARRLTERGLRKTRQRTGFVWEGVALHPTEDKQNQENRDQENRDQENRDQENRDQENRDQENRDQWNK